MTLADSTKDVVAVATANQKSEEEERCKSPSDLVNQDDAVSIFLASLLSKPVDLIEKRENGIQFKEKKRDELPVENIHPVEIKNTEKLIFPSDLLPRSITTSSMNEANFEQKNQNQKVKTQMRCLSAVVSGLKVLIPAESVHSIKNVTNALTPSTKIPVWLYEYHDGEDEAIQVVNTQKLIFEGVKSRRIIPDARTYLILIDDGSWGLSCDHVGEIVALTKPDITWRGHNTKRRWLAGTSNSQAAVILDVHKIEDSLIT